MTSISQRAIGMNEIPEHERPLSEQFRIVAKQYAEADAEHYFMAEFKTAMLEQMKTNLIAERGDMPDNKAERIVKSGSEWEDWVRKMSEAKKKANLLKAQMDWIKMKERQLDRDHWAGVQERKMGRTST